MQKFLHTLAFLIAAMISQGQVPEYAYFSPATCKELGLSQVTVYQLPMDSGKAMGLKGNNIHIANNIVRQIYFSPEGNRIKVQQLGRGGKIVEQEIHFLYGTDGAKTVEQLSYFHTNNSDSTKLLQKRITEFQYDYQKRLVGKVSSLSSNNLGQIEVVIDSISFSYDTTGKLTSEQLYDLSSMSLLLFEKTYIYSADKIVVRTSISGVDGNRDECELDKKGRKAKTFNFGPTDSIPLLETRFIYDSQDRPIEIQYFPNWAFSQRNETEVNRKNKFDNRGKLLEAQITFGDGKSVLEFYDASVFNEKE